MLNLNVCTINVDQSLNLGKQCDIAKLANKCVWLVMIVVIVGRVIPPTHKNIMVIDVEFKCLHH